MPEIGTKYRNSYCSFIMTMQQPIDEADLADVKVQVFDSNGDIYAGSQGITGAPRKTKPVVVEDPLSVKFAFFIGRDAAVGTWRTLVSFTDINGIETQQGQTFEVEDAETTIVYEYRDFPSFLPFIEFYAKVEEEVTVKLNKRMYDYFADNLPSNLLVAAANHVGSGSITNLGPLDEYTLKLGITRFVFYSGLFYTGMSVAFVSGNNFKISNPFYSDPAGIGAEVAPGVSNAATDLIKSGPLFYMYYSDPHWGITHETTASSRVKQLYATIQPDFPFPIRGFNDLSDLVRVEDLFTNGPLRARNSHTIRDNNLSLNESPGLASTVVDTITETLTCSSQIVETNIDANWDDGSNNWTSDGAEFQTVEIKGLTPPWITPEAGMIVEFEVASTVYTARIIASLGNDVYLTGLEGSVSGDIDSMTVYRALGTFAVDFCGAGISPTSVPNIEVWQGKGLYFSLVPSEVEEIKGSFIPSLRV